MKMGLFQLSWTIIHALYASLKARKDHFCGMTQTCSNKWRVRKRAMRSETVCVSNCNPDRESGATLDQIVIVCPKFRSSSARLKVMRLSVGRVSSDFVDFNFGFVAVMSQSGDYKASALTRLC